MDKLLQIGIDWQSIIMYIVNYGILFAVIGWLLVPKILQVLDERRKKIADSLSEADLLKTSFQKKVSEIEQEKEKTKAQMVAQMEELEATMEKKRTELVAEMEAERQVLIEKANQEIEARKKTMIKEAEGEMLALIQKIVLQVVQNKLPREVVDQSIQESFALYKK